MAASEYYSHGAYPSTGAAGSSAAMRAELESIETGISAKLPDLAGNGSKVVAVKSDASGLEALPTTGTGNGVRATSPSLTTPAMTGATVSAGPFRLSPSGSNVASGGTVSIVDADTHILNVGSGTKAALTFSLPAAPGNGPKVVIATNGAITAVTVSSASGHTIIGAPTTLAAGGFCAFLYLASATTWYRVG